VSRAEQARQLLLNSYASPHPRPGGISIIRKSDHQKEVHVWGLLNAHVAERPATVLDQAVPCAGLESLPCGSHYLSKGNV
jgi:hypothetical protein